MNSSDGCCTNHTVRIVTSSGSHTPASSMSVISPATGEAHTDTVVRELQLHVQNKQLCPHHTPDSRMSVISSAQIKAEKQGQSVFKLMTLQMQDTQQARLAHVGDLACRKE
jgi:hypothetical protein